MNFDKLEAEKDYSVAIEMIQKEFSSTEKNPDVYIRLIYYLLDVLLEQDYPERMHDKVASMLKKYYEESLQKYSESSDYLFFMGYFVELADWYFGEDQLKVANEMTLKAHQLEPNNILYDWSLKFSQNDPLAGVLSERILQSEKVKLDWLQSKGNPGIYLIRVIENCNKNYHN